MVRTPVCIVRKSSFIISKKIQGIWHSKLNFARKVDSAIVAIHGCYCIKEIWTKPLFLWTIQDYASLPVCELYRYSRSFSCNVCNLLMIWSCNIQWRWWKPHLCCILFLIFFFLQYLTHIYIKVAFHVMLFIPVLVSDTNVYNISFNE